MEYEALDYQVQGEIGVLTLNRPRVVNAINRKMLEELLLFWRQRHEDDQVRVIILTGGGEKGFCSGLDLKAAAEFGENGFSPEGVYNTQRLFSLNIRLMRTCPQPIVAALHGPVMGAGLAMACASDIRLARRNAFFCAQYINIGVGGADMGSSYFLWRTVGWGRAAQMCLTGEHVPAEEAYRIGLVTGVSETGEELLEEAWRLARSMVAKSRMGLRLTKEALNAGLDMSSLEDATLLEDRNQALMIVSGMMQTSLNKG